MTEHRDKIPDYPGVIIDGIIYRPFKEKDDTSVREVAQLIYETDPFIYPFWFSKKTTLAVKYFKEIIPQSGHFFSAENIFIARDLEADRIVGIIIAASNKTDLSHTLTAPDYLDPEHHDFTNRTYIQKVIKEAQELPDNALVVVNFCISPDYRRQHIGYHLLESFLNYAKESGYDEIHLDCLADNKPALNLYESLGFKIVAHGIGFDGTEHSQVKIVSLVRKDG